MVVTLNREKSTPEEFEENDIRPVKPFEIEEYPFGKECSVFFPATRVDSHGVWKGNQKFVKMVFATKKDARKEIKKYLKK